MNAFKSVLVLLVVLTVSVPMSFAQTGCPGHAAAAAADTSAAPASDTTTSANVGSTAATSNVKMLCAVFELPELTDEIAKEFSKSIGKEKGIVAVKPEIAQKQILVVFDDAVLNQEAMQKLVATNAASAKFVKMTDVPKDIKTGCGACPSRSSCQKATTK